MLWFELESLRLTATSLGRARQQPIRFVLCLCGVNGHNVDCVKPDETSWKIDSRWGRGRFVNWGNLRVNRWEKGGTLHRKHYKENITRRCFRFDLREFHRTILRCLGPLSALENCVADFVSGKTQGQNFDAQDSDGSRVPEPEIASSTAYNLSSSRNEIALLLLLLSRLLWGNYLRSSRN